MSIEPGWEMDLEIEAVLGNPTAIENANRPNELHNPVPPYSTVDWGAHILENEVEVRGLQYEYSNALVKVIGHQAVAGPLGWAFLRAKPWEKARAFLAMTRP